jgi:hypothetical protein
MYFKLGRNFSNKSLSLISKCRPLQLRKMQFSNTPYFDGRLQNFIGEKERVAN